MIGIFIFVLNNIKKELFMSEENRFEKRYIEGNLPWDVKRRDFNLSGLVEDGTISAGKVLELGCGTGDNAIWLAKNGFSVTACDYSKTAIDMARQKAKEENVLIEFYQLDFLKDRIPGEPYNFVFDRGCFHGFDLEEDRKTYAKNVASVLDEEGHWLSLIGSADDVFRTIGPPKRTSRDIVNAVEPFFEILFLKKSHFESDQTPPARIWSCLMQKRKMPD